MPGNEQKALRTLGERNAGVAHHHGRQPCAGGRCRKDESVFVDDIDAGGVARHQRVVDLHAHHRCLRRMRASQFAGAESHGRAVADQSSALGGVLSRKQLFRGDFAELRIAVIGVAIGIRELERLSNLVDVLGRVMTHLLDVVAFEDVQRLNHGWPLAPESRLVDRVSAIGCG